MDPYKRKREDELDEEQRDWRNLPSDILFEIYKHLDDDKADNEFELRRMRSVCTSWRSSLMPLKKPLQFPLKLPPPPSLLNKTYDSKEPFTTPYLSRSNILLFPSPPGPVHQKSGWIVKVEQRVESSKLRIQNPLLLRSASFKDPTLRRGSFDMFDCNVKEITRSYSLEYGKSIDKYPRKAKAVVCWNTNNSKDSNNGDFTVLVLFRERKLGLWRPGEAEWSIIPDPVFENGQIVINNSYFFSDIISFEGKFYATTKEARLIMIDPTTYEVRNLITVGLDLGYQFLMSYLVESNERLYLVYKDYYLSCDPDEQPGHVSVFMLEGINNNLTCAWNVVTNLEDRVFSATDYVTFSITAEGLGWSKGNYVILPFHDHFDLLRIHLFFSVDENLIDDNYENSNYFADYLGFYSLQDLKLYSGMKEAAQFTKIFWPPPDWLLSKN